MLLQKITINTTFSKLKHQTFIENLYLKMLFLQYANFCIINQALFTLNTVGNLT